MQTVDDRVCDEDVSSAESGWAVVAHCVNIDRLFLYNL
jgi:hypothetical protein